MAFPAAGQMFTGDQLSSTDDIVLSQLMKQTGVIWREQELPQHGA